MSDSDCSDFCVVPWTHAYVGVGGHRKLCTISQEKGNQQKLSLEEFWNGAEMKEVRLKMLKGERLQQCRLCWDKNNFLNPYKNYFNKFLFPNLVDEIREKTASDGSPTMPARSFDYRYSNDCNYSCRICHPDYSNRLEKEYQKEKVVYKSDNLEGLSEFKDSVKQEFLNEVRKGSVEEIYWVGGEPLFWPYHWEVMQEIVELGHSSQIYCRYNTNLSLLKFKGVHLIDDLLPHFKGFRIQASLDGVGQAGEYIRTGLNWQRWQKNFLEIHNFCKVRTNAQIYIDMTVTLPGIVHLKEMMEFTQKYEITVLPKLILPSQPDVVLSPLSLPRALLDQLIDRVQKEIKPFVSFDNVSIFRLLTQIKEQPNFEESFPDQYQEQFDQGRQKLLAMEAWRQDSVTLSDLYQKIPELQEWWQS